MKSREREYVLQSETKTERSHIRVFVPAHETEEEVKAFRRECAKVVKDIFLRMHRDGELEAVIKKLRDEGAIIDKKTMH